MMFKKFSLFLFIFVGCAAAPAVRTFFVAPGIVQYFLPPTEWTVENSSKMKVRFDVTYRTGVETPPTINLSFVDPQKNIGGVSAAFLSGGGAEYPLHDITVLYFDPKTHELRVSSTGDRDTLADTLGASDLVLKAVVDGVEYTFIPGKQFPALRDQFVAGIRH
jgi:hypothetical protein